MKEREGKRQSKGSKIEQEKGRTTLARCSKGLRERRQKVARAEKLNTKAEIERKSDNKSRGEVERVQW